MMDGERPAGGTDHAEPACGTADGADAVRLADLIAIAAPARLTLACGEAIDSAVRDRIAASPRLREAVARTVARWADVPPALSIPASAARDLLLADDDRPLSLAVQTAAAAFYDDRLRAAVRGPDAAALRDRFGARAVDLVLSLPATDPPWRPGADQAGLDAGWTALAAWLSGRPRAEAVYLSLRLDPPLLDRRGFSAPADRLSAHFALWAGRAARASAEGAAS
jgi:hypothetical protein